MRTSTIDYYSAWSILLILLIVWSTTNAHEPPPPGGVVGKDYNDGFYCNDPGVRCEGILITCPSQCPAFKPTEDKTKACYVNCNAKNCEAICRSRKANCNGIGSACYDPRFVGGDGVMFYFHGKTNEHFSLVSDHNLQINARFIGRRPTGRSRDNTWIQSLGLMFDSHSFTLSANKVPKWDDEIDQLSLTYNGVPLMIPRGHLSTWSAPDSRLKVERTTWANSVTVTLPGVLEMSVTVVPVTKEDDLKHNYQIPSDDCFAHLETQFKFSYMSDDVEGVLGQTYRPDFKNPVKRGVPMPVMGGEDRFKTSSLLAYDCRQCIFKGNNVVSEANMMELDSSRVDCSSKMSGGRGIVCRR